MAVKSDKDISDVTHEEMLEALKRSGYIFESEVVSMLIEKGYNVEPNILYRGLEGEYKFEIDLQVEISKYKKYRNLIVRFSLNLVFKLKNYASPLVMFTPKQDVFLYHNYFSDEYIFHVTDKFRRTFGDAWCNYIDKNMLDGIGMDTEDDRYKYYYQYCVFQTNSQDKNKITATQDEKIHKAIQNLHQYCLEQTIKLAHDTSKEKSICISYYLPILLVKNKIYEFRKSNGTGTLSEVDESKLLISSVYHGDVKKSLMYITNQSNLISMIERISTDFDELLYLLSIS